MHVTPSVFALWERWEAETGTTQPPPFWAVPWPGAALMASWLLANPQCVYGREVIDVGCGSALAAIAAVRAGSARVVANDVDPTALAAAELNAILNGAQLYTCGADLTAVPNPARAADVLLVCELFYEAGPAKRLIQWLDQQRRQAARIFVADGERSFLPRQRLQLLRSQTMATNSELEGTPSRLVSLYEWS